MTIGLTGTVDLAVDQMNTPGDKRHLPDKQPIDATDTTDGNPIDASSSLAPGIHPFDQSVTGPYHQDRAVPPDTVGNRFTTGTKNFTVDNAAAVPVFERSAHDFTAGSMVLSGEAGSGQSTQIVGRQKGRVSVTLWVPASAPFGVCFAGQQGELQGAATPAILYPGDSITIPTEAPVFVAVVPGNASGTVQWMVAYNPPGGELGGN